MPLPETGDRIGSITEIYRADRQFGVGPVQWNFVNSLPNTLRGVHVHVEHFDYLCVVRGEMLLALHDMRPDSPTYRLTVHPLLSGNAPCSAVIPPGVAHGFYFAAQASYFYAVSHYWNMADELGCRWNDPALNIAWPTSSPLLSARDANAPTYAEMARALSTALDGRAMHP